MLLKEQEVPSFAEAGVQQVMKVLEESDSGTISKQELKNAVREVAQSNGKQMSSAETTALIEKVFSQADTQRTGAVTRV